MSFCVLGCDSSSSSSSSSGLFSVEAVKFIIIAQT